MPDRLMTMLGHSYRSDATDEMPSGPRLPKALMSIVSRWVGYLSFSPA